MESSKKFALFLFPSVFNSVISLLLIPLTTARLGPRDYGVFAVLESYGGLVTSFSMLGGGYLWAYHFPKLDLSDKSGFVSTLFFVGFIATLFWSIIFWFSWPVLQSISNELGSGEKRLFSMVLIGGVLNYPWIHAVELLTLTSMAKKYALIITISTVVSALTTLFCLYQLGLGVQSLFWSSMAGSAVFGFGSLFNLNPYLSLDIQRKWLMELIRRGFPTMPGNILESTAIASERNIMSSVLSLSSLGIYTHSQIYLNKMAFAIKALSRTIWPISLEEARAGSRNFSRTLKAWKTMGVFLTLTGLMVAAIGTEFIKAMTHDKFTESAVYVTCWFIFMSIQNSGKEPMAILYAANHGIYITYLTVITRISSIVLLIVMVPFFHIWGAVAVAITVQLLYRLMISLRALKVQITPFNDGHIIINVMFISSGLALQLSYMESPIVRILSILLLILVYCIYNRSILVDLLNQLQNSRYQNTKRPKVHAEY